MASTSDFFSLQVMQAYEGKKGIKVTEGLASVAFWAAHRAELPGSVGTPQHVAELLARINRSVPRENHYVLECIGMLGTLRGR
jgi:hypothetical protein